MNIAIKSDAYGHLLYVWKSMLTGHDMTDEKLRELVALIHMYLNPENLNLSKFKDCAGIYNVLQGLALDTIEMIVLNKSAQAAACREYFLQLVAYFSEVRRMMATVSGLDVLKANFFPDGHPMLKTVFGVSWAAVCRAVFGVTYLYSLAKADTLSAISFVSKKYAVLQFQAVRIDANNKEFVQEEAMQKELKEQLQLLDYKFRHPSRHSIAMGKDYFGRNLNMLKFLFYGLWLGGSFGVLLLNYINTILAWFGWMDISLPAYNLIQSSPGYLGLSLANIPVFFYIALFWLNPLHSYSAVKNEFEFYGALVHKYRNKPPLTKREAEQYKQERKKYTESWQKGSSYASFLLGMFEPVIIPLVFLWQQYKLFRMDGTQVFGKQPEEKHAAELLVFPKHGRKSVFPSDEAMLPDSRSVTLQKGGIDLNMDRVASKEVLVPTVTSLYLNFPVEDFKGFDFNVVQFTPLFDPATFLISGTP